MSKTITITPALERDIVYFCDDELNYHINDSGCADEYLVEIKAQLKLLKLLGYEDMAKRYAKDLREELRQLRQEK